MSATTPIISQALGKSRWIVLGIALCLVSGVILSLVSSNLDRTRFSIHNPREEGVMALTEVLADHGTSIKDVYTLSQAQDYGTKDTVVVVNPNKITDKSLREIMNLDTNLVFLGTYLQNSRFEPYVTAVGKSSGENVPSRCDFAPAQAAHHLGPIRGSLRPSRVPDQACFALDQQSFAFVSFTRPNGLDISFLSDARIATNTEIVQAGNAAFLLNLLGGYQNIGWLLGETFQQSEASGEAGVIGYPPQFRWAMWVFFVSLVVFALASGRRLGRVVPEDVPVQVPGAESIYGRARLYRQAKAWDRAAQYARRHAAQRITAALHLPTPVSPETLTSQISQLSGWEVSQVQLLFFGDKPINAGEFQTLLKDLRTLTGLVTNQKGNDGKRN